MSEIKVKEKQSRLSIVVIGIISIVGIAGVVICLRKRSKNKSDD